MERQIFELTNIYRENHGVPRVENIIELNELAKNHSKDMAIENYFYISRLRQEIYRIG